MQLGRGETIADTARVLSRYVDAIMIRTDAHEKLLELAAHATVPIINGLTDHSHPCQIMADVQTIEEHRGPIAGKTLAWVGDGNNVLTSLVHAAVAARLRPQRRHAARAGARRRRCWTGPQQRQGRLQRRPRPGGGRARASMPSSPTPGCRWARTTRSDRYRLLEPFRVDERLMAHAATVPCSCTACPRIAATRSPPAVIDGPQSVVFDAAENRLHAQKAIIEWCLEG